MSAEYPYARVGDQLIWEDPHVQRGLLHAHLDEGTFAASRPEAVRKATLDWFARFAPAPRRVLDVGCGPGLYAGHMIRAGYEVTGVDINGTSLEFARAAVPDASFHQMNYLEGPLPGPVDAAMMIYCDLGALFPAERDLLVSKIRGVLPVGGVFVFDLVDERLNAVMKEESVTSRHDEGGFWSPVAHTETTTRRHFPSENAWGSFHRIEGAEGVREFATFDHVYDETRVRLFLAAAGFELLETDVSIVPDSDFAVGCTFYAARAI